MYSKVDVARAVAGAVLQERQNRASSARGITMMGVSSCRRARSLSVSGIAKLGIIKDLLTMVLTYLPRTLSDALLYSFRGECYTGFFDCVFRG